MLTKEILIKIFENNLISVPKDNPAGDIWLWNRRWVSGKFGSDTMQQIYEELIEALLEEEKL